MKNNDLFHVFIMLIITIVSITIILSVIIISNTCAIRDLQEKLEGKEESYWHDWVEQQEMLSNWEQWDHGNKVTYNDELKLLEMDFWADGYAIVELGGGIAVDGESYDYCEMSDGVYNLSTCVGCSYCMHLNINHNDTIRVMLYRDPDPWYGYVYALVEWIFEAKT